MLDRFLWAIGLLGHLTLLFVLVRRRLLRTFPVFAVLIAFNVVRTGILFLVRSRMSAEAYFDAYWILQIADVVLGLMLFVEATRLSLDPLRGINSAITKWLIAGCSLSVITAAVVTWLALAPGATMLESLVMRGDFFASVLMSELFVCMVALSAILKLPWNSQIAGIVQGLGVYNLFCFALSGIENYTGFGDGVWKVQLTSRVRIVTYLACLTYWCVTLWAEKPLTKPLTEEQRTDLYAFHRSNRRMLANLRRWRDAP